MPTYNRDRTATPMPGGRAPADPGAQQPAGSVSPPDTAYGAANADRGAEEAAAARVRRRHQARNAPGSLEHRREGGSVREEPAAMPYEGSLPPEVQAQRRRH